MVYSKILIIAGMVVSTEDLLKAYPEALNEMVAGIYAPAEDLTELGFESDIKIYSWACCSSLNNKSWIVGKKLDKIRRCTRYRCPECIDDLWVCDKCIGQTEYGFFDVNQIHESVVRMGEAGTPYYTGDSGLRFHPKFTMESQKVDMKKLTENVKLPKKLVKNQRLVNPVEVFYMVDDCLSCT